MAAYKIGVDDRKNPEWLNPSHFPDEIRLNRSLSNIKGNVFFNTSGFLKNPLGIADSLKNDIYNYYSIVPFMPWMSSEIPDPPVLQISIENSKTKLSWNKSNSVNGFPVVRYLVYRFDKSVYDNNPVYIADIIGAGENTWTDKFNNSTANNYSYAVSSLSRNNIESRLSNIVSNGNDITPLDLFNPLTLNVSSVVDGKCLITFPVKIKSLIALRVYNDQGVQIGTLVNEIKKEGNYEVSYSLPGKNKFYIFQLCSNGYISTYKVKVNL